MGIYYTGIIYGIDLSDQDSEDLDFWYSLQNEHYNIAAAKEIQGILTTNINEGFPFIGYAIAYDYSYRSQQDKAGTLSERIIVTPSLQEYCELYFPDYCKIANDSWDKLVSYIQEKYPDYQIPKREFFAIEDYD